METDTSWRRGRFGSAAGSGQVLFGRMYEDVEIERSAFRPGCRVFSIASAGCTAIRLSADHEVTAVDINPVQLAYAQRRTVSAPMEIGSAERLMQTGRRAFPLLGWRRSVLAEFLELEDVREQMSFWRRYLDTWRFRAAFDAAMSHAALRLTYAAGFLSGMPAKIGPVLRARMERCWALHPNRSNPYAKTLLLGDVVPELEPSPDIQRASAIRFACADAASYLEGCAAGSFDAFTLSNILDGATEKYRLRLFAAIKYAATKDAVVVIRSFAEPESKSPTNFAALDRAMLWGVVEVVEANALELWQPLRTQSAPVETA